MADAIGPGDWVEFIGLPRGWTPTGRTPRTHAIGQIYRVTEAGRVCVDGAGKRWPSLCTTVTPHFINGRRVSTPVDAFRPVYRPKAEIIEALKQPASMVDA